MRNSDRIKITYLGITENIKKLTLSRVSAMMFTPITKEELVSQQFEFTSKTEEITYDDLKELYDSMFVAVKHFYKTEA